MKIAFVCDSPDWAIGHLAESVAKYNKQHQILMLYVHPRDAGEVPIQQSFLKQIEEFKPDLIDFEYFRTASQLIEALPQLHKYKIVLMHHNMRTKALYSADWQNNPEIKSPHLKIDKVLAHCNKTKMLLEDAGYAKNVEIIRYGFDHDFWTYTEKEPEELTLGYSGRVVPWKKLKEIAEVAVELKYPLEIMGKLDKADYWDTIPRESLRYNFMDCDDKDRADYFREITVFVQNSIDGYEEGPMPLMEAMACGVPVITTPAGQAGYEEGIFKDRENCLLIPFDDKEALKTAVQELMSNKELRDKLRRKGWETVKNMTEEKMARSYSKIWNKVVYPDYELASIIIPTTYDRHDQLLEVLKAMKTQTYPNIEAVIAYDEEVQPSKINRELYEFPIKEVWTDMDKKKYPYNLAMARNKAVIEAEGSILILNDSRLKPDENAIMMFVEAVKNASAISLGGSKKVWFFGDKGAQKTSFVENFSAIRKEHLVNIGMFNERINRYGGMTQDIRNRWSKNKGVFSYLGLAVCEPTASSHKSTSKRQDIVKTKLKLYKMYGEDQV